MKAVEVVQVLTPPGRPKGMPRQKWREMNARGQVVATPPAVSSAVQPKTHRSNNPPPASTSAKTVRGHREVFSEQVPASINGNATGASQMISVNPGDSTLFTRLYQLANLYQEYKFHKFKVRYIPNGSAFAANNQTGEIVIAATDNFHSSISPSVSAARARTPSVSGNAWEPITFNVPSSIIGKWRSLRAGLTAVGAEPNIFDFLLEIFVYQTPNTNGIGYIEFTGDVEMRGDYVTNTVNAPLTNRMWSMVQTGNQALVSGAAADLTITGASISPNSLLSGVYSPAGVFVGLAGGSYKVEARAYVQGTTVTSVVLVPVVTGASYSSAMPSNPGIGGSSFSVGGIEVSHSFVVTIPEDTTGNLKYTINVVGTGALTVNDWSLTILAL